MSEELKAILGDKADAAVSHLVALGQSEETAIGHLEMLIKGQGQFNAALDGGLADIFPELFAAHEKARGMGAAVDSEPLTLDPGEVVVQEDDGSVSVKNEDEVADTDELLATSEDLESSKLSNDGSATE